jgi:hypothetical protein
MLYAAMLIPGHTLLMNLTSSQESDIFSFLRDFQPNHSSSSSSSLVCRPTYIAYSLLLATTQQLGEAADICSTASS